MTYRKRFATALAVAAMASTMLVSGSASAGSTHTHSYLPPNDVYGFCDIEPMVPGVVDQPWGVNIGAVCMEVPGGTSEGRIKSIADTVSPSSSYAFYWMDKDWNEVGDKSIVEDPEAWLLGPSGDNHFYGCAGPSESSVWYDKPGGAKYVYIFLNTPALGWLDCEIGEGFATAGTVTLQFR